MPSHNITELFLLLLLRFFLPPFLSSSSASDWRCAGLHERDERPGDSKVPFKTSRIALIQVERNISRARIPQKITAELWESSTAWLTIWLRNWGHVFFRALEWALSIPHLFSSKIAEVWVREWRGEGGKEVPEFLFAFLLYFNFLFSLSNVSASSVACMLESSSKATSSKVTNERNVKHLKRSFLEK